MTVIIVSNTGSKPRGEILGLKTSDHKFTANERKQEWIKSGKPKSDWQRLTTLVYVTDKTVEELQYLLDPYISQVTIPPQRLGNKYHFAEPDPANPLWIEMFHNGEIHKTWAEIEPYVRERI